jgi:hypothetical protein
MKQPQVSRIRDQRVDIKVGPEVYGELAAVKALLEQVKLKSYSMSEIVGLLCQWSEPQIAELEELRARLDVLATKKKPPKIFK